MIEFSEILRDNITKVFHLPRFKLALFLRRTLKVPIQLMTAINRYIGSMI